MKLFDSKFIKKLPNIRKFGNPYVVFLCKNKDPGVINFRNQIEKWFQDLPESSKGEMYSRLRSSDNIQHLSAFYELFFHQYAIKKKWETIKDPDTQGKKPDYLMHYQKDASFYLEVATVFQEEKLRKEEEVFNKLLEKIDNLKTPFLITVHLKKWFDENADYKKIILFIKNWLNGLPKTEDKIYKTKLNNFGFEGSFNAIFRKKANKKHGCILYHMSPVRWGNWYVGEIRKIISAKGKRYKFSKDNKIPFVVAICSGGDFFLDELSLDWALYGSERLVVSKINTSNPETKIQRGFDGLVTPKPTLRKARNTRISAVIFCERRWGIKREKMLYNMKVYHNPWAVNPLAIETFSDLPQMVKHKEDKKSLTLKWRNNRKQGVFLE